MYNMWYKLYLGHCSAFFKNSICLALLWLPCKVALSYIMAHTTVMPYEWLCRRCACNNKYIWNTKYLSINVLLVCLILRRAWNGSIGIFVANSIGARFALLVFCFILPKIWYIHVDNGRFFKDLKSIISHLICMDKLNSYTYLLAKLLFG